MVIGVAELIGVGWVYSKPFCTSLKHKLINDIEKMIGPMNYSRWFFIFTWTFVAPITITFILIYDVATFGSLVQEGYPWTYENTEMGLVYNPNGTYVMPDWSVTLGWSMVGVSPGIIIVYSLWVACYEYNGYKAVLLATRPSQWVGADSRIQSRAVSRAASRAASRAVSRRNSNATAGRYHRHKPHDGHTLPTSPGSPINTQLINDNPYFSFEQNAKDTGLHSVRFQQNSPSSENPPSYINSGNVNPAFTSSTDAVDKYEDVTAF